MKKTFANIRTLAALLIASAALAACSNEDSGIISEQPAQQQAPQVYTLTLQAGKADNAQTRALDLDGENLVASWADGDQLTVTMADGTVVGTLTAPTASGRTATFSGTLTVPSGKTISGGDKLTLTYHPVASDDYSDQTGTLASAAKCDMATAEVTVATVEGGEITITETSVNFTTQTAVLKITMQDAGGNKINATELKVSAASGTAINIFSFSPTAATYMANGDGILYFALPNAASAQAMLTAKNSTLATFLSSATVSFTVTKDDESYTVNTGKKYTFAAGIYYATTLTKPAPATKKLTLTGQYFDPNIGDDVPKSLEIEYTDNDTWKDIAERYAEVSLRDNGLGPEGKVVQFWYDEDQGIMGCELKSNESTYSYDLVSFNDKVSAYSSYFLQ